VAAEGSAARDEVRRYVAAALCVVVLARLLLVVTRQRHALAPQQRALMVGRR